MNYVFILCLLLSLSIVKGAVVIDFDEMKDDIECIDNQIIRLIETFNYDDFEGICTKDKYEYIEASSYRTIQNINDHCIGKREYTLFTRVYICSGIKSYIKQEHKEERSIINSILSIGYILFVFFLAIRMFI